MLLMVFVNDLWSLRDIPNWLEHTSAEDDAMGFSDVIFPAFLFIVGLSIPFAINSRIKKGDSRKLIVFHIFQRSFALIIMGFFMVNHEYSRQDLPYISWNERSVLMVIAFLLIWNHYEKNKVFKFIPVKMLQSIGIFILALLVITYNGSTYNHMQWMTPHWWGILGLIGWSYLFISILYVMTGKSLWVSAFFLIIWNILNAQEFYPIYEIKGFKFIISASNYALVMSGTFASVIFLKMKNTEKEMLYPSILLLLAIVSITYGFSERHLWGISKILGTPSWTTICAGISLITFAVVYIISDVLHYTKWARWLMPAGRNTLVCYLLPGIVYIFFYPQIRQIPLYLTTSITGIVKSLLFAFTIVIITGILEKLKIKIKL